MVITEKSYIWLITEIFISKEDISAFYNTVIRNIEMFENMVRDDLATLKYFQSNLEHVLNEEDHLYFYLTVLFGIESYEAYLRWCQKAKSLLSSK